jgi:transposase-like protein
LAAGLHAEALSHGLGAAVRRQVSRLCAEIDERVQTFLHRPIEGEWPYLWVDATYVKVRRDHHIVSVAVIVAVAVNTDGRREVLGMTVGNSEAEPFWTEFLRSLARRGPRGVKLVVSDAHEGLKAAIAKVLGATWQRCRVHFMRNAMAHAGKTQRRIVSAWIGTAFAQDDADVARQQWRQVADQARPRVSKLATLMDDAEADVLAYMGFPSSALGDPRTRSLRTGTAPPQAPQSPHQLCTASPVCHQVRLMLCEKSLEFGPGSNEGRHAPLSHLI